MFKRICTSLCSLGIMLSSVSFMESSVFAMDYTGSIIIDFTDENITELEENGNLLKTNGSAEGGIEESGISHNGDGAVFKVSHITGKSYNSVENAVRLTLGTPLSGNEAYTISAWFYIPSEGNKDIERKDELIGPAVLINGNSGDVDFKYPTSVEEAGWITYDEWINVTFRTKILGTDINYIDFRFYTNDMETHPEIWYIDDIFVGITADKPEILTKKIEYGTITIPYEQVLSALGNDPITWSIKSGSLPSGLELTSDGIIKGIPLETTTDAVFTVEAKNEFGTGVMEYNLIVYETDSVFTLAKTTGKQIGNSNPLYTQKYGADPWAMEYDGRLYLYMTNDIYEYDSDGKVTANSYGKIKHINVISSADLVNWTDHGSIPVAGFDGIATWANNSWAPCAVWRNENGTDKFYLYFTNGGGGIGVLVGDSPIGPWTDPNGKALVNHNTPNCSGNLVPWCFDPAVFIDDDGTGYLYFGGGIINLDPANPKSGRVVKLKDNLTEIDGIPEEIAPPYFFEATATHKYNGKYYLTYSSNFQSPGSIPGVQPASGNIAYMVSDNPMGPFEYAGEVLNNPGNFGFGGGNNHQCVFQFLGEWYITYHTSLVYMDIDSGKTGYRSTSVDKLTYDSDGMMNAVKGTKIGIPQLKTINPYERIEAETIAWNGKIKTVMEDPTQKSSTNLYVTGIENGKWISIAQADLENTNPLTFTANVAGKRGGTIELRTGSPDPDDSKSELVATLSVDAGDGTSWNVINAPITVSVKGTQDLFLVFKGDANKIELFDIDWWQLSLEGEVISEAITSEDEKILSDEEASVDPTISNEQDISSDDDVSLVSSDKVNENSWLTPLLIICGVALITLCIVIFIKKKKV